MCSEESTLWCRPAGALRLNTTHTLRTSRSTPGYSQFSFIRGFKYLSLQNQYSWHFLWLFVATNRKWKTCGRMHMFPAEEDNALPSVSSSPRSDRARKLWEVGAAFCSAVLMGLVGQIGTPTQASHTSNLFLCESSRIYQDELWICDSQSAWDVCTPLGRCRHSLIQLSVATL